MKAGQVLICQCGCTKAACWYVWDESSDVTLALCEEHKTEILQRAGRVVGKINDPRMWQQELDALEWEKWLADSAGRLSLVVKWNFNSLSRLTATEITKVLREEMLEGHFNELVELLEKAGWIKHLGALEGEYWTKIATKASPDKTKVLLHSCDNVLSSV